MIIQNITNMIQTKKKKKKPSIMPVLNARNSKSVLLDVVVWICLAQGVALLEEVRKYVIVGVGNRIFLLAKSWFSPSSLWNKI